MIAENIVTVAIEPAEHTVNFFKIFNFDFFKIVIHEIAEFDDKSWFQFIKCFDALY